MNKGRPINRMVKVRVGLGGRVVKHAFIGALFALINETSFRFFQKKSDEDNEILFVNPKEIEMDPIGEAIYKKEDIFKKIDGNFHFNSRKTRRQSEFLKNFLYGSMIVFMGVEATRKLKEMKKVKGLQPMYHVFLAISFAIVPYYAFCSFYDQKTPREFLGKLGEDFLPLALAKFVFETININYSEKIKTMGFDNIKKVGQRVRVATAMLMGFNILWIFMLTSFYHERMSLKSFSLKAFSFNNRKEINEKA